MALLFSALINLGMFLDLELWACLVKAKRVKPAKR
jgi:hypothetical protein